MITAVLFAASVGLSAHDASRVREAVVRSAVAGEDPRFFVAYCLSIAPRVVRAGRPQDERFRGVFNADEPDAPTDLLQNLKSLPHRFVPGSACKKTSGDYDIIERGTRRKPALRIVLGPIEAVSDDRVLVLQFTTSGQLSESVTEYEVARQPSGEWKVTRKSVLLQS